MAARTDYRTRFGGAFDRATGADPFALPPAFLAKRKAIDRKGRLDFVYAADTIGGNSGSPVIDRQGQRHRRQFRPQHPRPAQRLCL